MRGDYSISRILFNGEASSSSGLKQAGDDDDCVWSWSAWMRFTAVWETLIYIDAVIYVFNRLHTFLIQLVQSLSFNFGNVFFGLLIWGKMFYNLLEHYIYLFFEFLDFLMMEVDK